MGIGPTAAAQPATGAADGSYMRLRPVLVATDPSEAVTADRPSETAADRPSEQRAESDAPARTGDEATRHSEEATRTDAEGTDASAGIDTEPLESVVAGAVVTLGGILLQRGLRFLTNLALTAALGVGLYGVFAFSRQILAMLRTFSLLGADVALLRFVPDADGRRRNRVLGLGVLTTLVTSLAFTVGLFLAADRLNRLTLSHPAFPGAVRVFALVVPFTALAMLASAVFRSLERPAYHAVVIRFCLPLANLAGAAIAVYLDLPLVGLVVATVLTTAVASILAVALVYRRTSLRPALTRSRREVTQYLDFALPTTVSKVGGLLRSRVDVLLVGALLSASAAGVYNITLFLSALIAVPLLAVNQLFPPVASRLYNADRHEDTVVLYRAVTRWTLTGGLAIATAELVYGPELLALFGPAFVRGEAVLALFVVGQLVNCGVGSAGYLLQMTDHQYLNAANNWALGVLNLGLSYAFVLEFGLVGAALGTAGSLAVVNVVRVAELWYLEGIFPYTRRFVKPFLAAGGMALAMVALDGLLPPSLVLAVGLPVGFGAFFVVLVAAGVERVDRALARTLLARYRS